MSENAIITANPKSVIFKSEKLNAVTAEISGYINEVEVADGVKSLGNHAFANCTRLASIQLPDSLADLGEGTFANCFMLSSVSIPYSVTELKENTFYNCTKIAALEYMLCKAGIGLRFSPATSCTVLPLIVMPRVMPPSEFSFPRTQIPCRIARAS